MEYFKSNYNSGILTVRVYTSDTIRRERGFIFQEGVDDAETECDLDHYKHDFTLDNSVDGDSEMQNVSHFIVEKHLKTS